jgi:hypothetical protein
MASGASFITNSDRRSLVVERGDRRADEQREDDDLEDLVLGHGVDDGGRHQVGDEALQGEGLGAGGRRGGRRRGLHVQARSWLQQVDHHQPDQQRDDRGADEPAHGLGADPADRCGVLHVGDAGHQGGEDQRGDDHLDQPQEDIGDQR